MINCINEKMRRFRGDAIKSCQCLECCEIRERKRRYAHKWRKNNPEKVRTISRKYREENHEKVLEATQKWRRENPDKVNTSRRRRRDENPEAYREVDRKSKAKWREENLEKVRELARDYQSKRYQNDPQFKLAITLRNRLNRVIKRGQKAGSVVRDLGCSIEALKEHLERQFQEGMTWDNYGDWHIDHILPLSSFDLTDREQFLKACHYTNLQPLWKLDNLSKGARIWL